MLYYNFVMYEKKQQLNAYSSILPVLCCFLLHPCFAKVMHVVDTYTVDMYTVCVCIYMSIVKIPFCNQEIITCNNHMPTCNQKDISLLTSNPYFLFLFSTNSLVFQPNLIVLFFCCLFFCFLKTVSVFLFTPNNFYVEPLYLFGFSFLAFFASPPPSSCFFFFLLFSPLCLSSPTVFAVSR